MNTMLNNRRFLASTLRKARDLMNHDGSHWTKGTWFREMGAVDGGDQFCSMGGINAALAGDKRGYIDYSEESDAARKLALILVKSNPQIGSKRDRARLQRAIRKGNHDEAGMVAVYMVTGWNDNKKTKWEDVKAAFTQAARSLR